MRIPAITPVGGTAAPVLDHPRSRRTTRRVSVIAHRGASGYRPEHTLAAYQLAIEQGADAIEPDLVSTRDGVLVARHENEISATTDVAEHPAFAGRRTTKDVDGRAVTGWFTEDFTLAELKTLRAVERLPQVRPGNTAYDRMLEVPTFDEVLALARRESRRLRRTIGVVPETKHPTHFDQLGLGLTAPLLRSLAAVGWNRRDAPVVVQSFETSNLRELARWSRVPLMQLTAGAGAPHDLAARGVTTSYADMLTPEGLRDVRRYARWVGAAKDTVVPRDGTGRLGLASTLVQDAHRAGLMVGAYTFRAENRFLPTDLRLGASLQEHGDLRAELGAFLVAGVDGVFVDFPDHGVAARRALARR